MTLRTHRRICWAVIVVATVYLVGWSAYCLGEWNMARSVKGLQAEAAVAIAAENYDDAFAACRELDKKKPNGYKLACAIRGECFDHMGQLPEAFVQYQAAGDLGDTVAASSAADVLKRMQKGGK